MSKQMTRESNFIKMMVIVATVLVITAIAIAIYNLSNTNETSNTNSSEEAQIAESLPEVNNSSDLAEAQKAVEDIDPDAIDMAELDEVLQ